jgi:hypothetical protein
MSTPISIEEGHLRIKNHPNGKSADDKTYYIKLEIPNKTYGLPMLLDLALHPKNDVTRNQYIRTYINEITWMLKICNLMGIGGPEVMSTNIRLRHNHNFFYTVLPKFGVDIATSINWHLAYLDSEFLINMQDVYKEENKQFARDAWLPLIH